MAAHNWQSKKKQQNPKIQMFSFVKEKKTIEIKL